MDDVGGIGVDITKVYFIADAEIVADSADIAPIAHSPENVHSGVEDLTKTSETLESAAAVCIFLYDCHPDPLLCKQGAGEKAAETSSDNHN